MDATSMSMSPKPTMSTAAPSFVYSTFLNSTPAPFVKPTTMPTGIFSFGPVMSCPSSSGTAQPSGAPIGVIQNPQAGCMISNSAADGNHAFWDLYDCCKARNILALGKPLPCSAQCLVGSEQTWQDLAGCLRKRNAVVVCKLPADDAGTAGSSLASGNGTTASIAPGSATTSSGQTSMPSLSSTASLTATAGASSVDPVQATFSKAGLFLFALVAVTSAAGMFL